MRSRQDNIHAQALLPVTLTDSEQPMSDGSKRLGTEARATETRKRSRACCGSQVGGGSGRRSLLLLYMSSSHALYVQRVFGAAVSYKKLASSSNGEKALVMCTYRSRKRTGRGQEEENQKCCAKIR